MTSTNSLSKTKIAFNTGSGEAHLYSLKKLEELGYGNISKLPFTIKILLEAVLREFDGYAITENDIKLLANYNAKSPEGEIPFKPSRVVLQDFTGVPAVVDLAALRSAMKRMGGNPTSINPQVPVDLVIDHSVQVDMFGRDAALMFNVEKEMERNNERYQFLKWGKEAFDNFRVVPPGRGIVHQVNLEYLAKGVFTREEEDGSTVAYPDTLVGTDSHTTMINGLGILGWGVGGIEAEAAMLGQPISMLVPEVVGMKLTGALREGVTATDLTLTVTQMLRKHGVVGKFVEFYGDGISNMSLPDRATIANMSPEYGATMGFFPIDEESLRYMKRTGRSEELVDLVENYTKAQGLFRTDDIVEPEFSSTLELDLSTVETSLAGPKLPHDRIILSNMKKTFKNSLTSDDPTMGFSLAQEKLANKGIYKNGREIEMKHGDVVIAAITSCTNTSNPSVMLGAGIVAKKAYERGLKVPEYVKTSLAPGSRVVTEYLKEAGLTEYMDNLGFNLVGYGCTTCIGNSGPLPEPVEKAVKEGDLIVAGVLSGNRNFEGRIHPYVKANYLASPPLVVAYALAGSVDIDLANEPIGKDKDGKDVYLKEIWPTTEEIAEHLDNAIRPELFEKMYSDIFESETWEKIPVKGGDLFEWSDESTYIQEPPFFIGMGDDPEPIKPIKGAKVLVKVGDSITTDHISPAGNIKEDSPAGEYLKANGVKKKDFNSYGSRRGNDRVMTRGTFANVRFKNQLAPGKEGGFTKYHPTGKITTIFDASLKYKESDTPLVALAGTQYGTGSSRDWAAKGTDLLGVKCVIAVSYERIHRSNLIQMGVLPLQFKEGDSADSLGLDGTETFDIHVDDDVQAGDDIKVTATKDDGSTVEFMTDCRIDTPVEVEYYRNGGILHKVLRDYVEEDKQKS
ncbi:aconitate hydratase AcnA [Rhodohalobacter sulfatireducens]|uniref:Aconitate hydratase n=1 Tax=Rhodohalobacter sulfatireducens TaxID=2911366 RepID=A0ABS9KGF7_9BACT|nr:aconitate hydratase AcnA [Rhodohalobacter sulfatireducens]MCG2589923.1 aconitate hydratase AcnA [Rhodohalobacter sulfatireducens]